MRGRPTRQEGVLGVFQARLWFYRHPVEVGGNVFIIHSKIHLREISFNAYRKIPYISFYFSKALLEGLIFRGAYLRREICVSKSIGLTCSGKEIYHFCFVLLCIQEEIPSTSPPGVLYSEGRFNGGFFALRFWGAFILRGLFSEFYGISKPFLVLIHSRVQRPIDVRS